MPQFNSSHKEKDDLESILDQLNVNGPTTPVNFKERMLEIGISDSEELHDLFRAHLRSSGVPFSEERMLESQIFVITPDSESDTRLGKIVANLSRVHSGLRIGLSPMMEYESRTVGIFSKSSNTLILPSIYFVKGPRQFIQDQACPVISHEFDHLEIAKAIQQGRLLGFDSLLLECFPTSESKIYGIVASPEEMLTQVRDVVRIGKTVLPNSYDEDKVFGVLGAVSSTLMISDILSPALEAARRQRAHGMPMFLISRTSELTVPFTYIRYDGTLGTFDMSFPEGKESGDDLEARLKQIEKRLIEVNLSLSAFRRSPVHLLSEEPQIDPLTVGALINDAALRLEECSGLQDLEVWSTEKHYTPIEAYTDVHEYVAAVLRHQKKMNKKSEGHSKEEIEDSIFDAALSLLVVGYNRHHLVYDSNYGSTVLTIKKFIESHSQLLADRLYTEIDPHCLSELEKYLKIVGAIKTVNMLSEKENQRQTEDLLRQREILEISAQLFGTPIDDD